MSTQNIKSIRDLELANQTALMRLDFNVPLSDPDSQGHRKVEDDSRITEALPTIKLALEMGAKIVLCSHLGRPDGKVKPEFSLEPVADHLSTLLDMDITLADDCVGDGIEMMVKNLKRGQILMLENLRFHAEEEKNDLEFSQKLARLGTVYINDAFGTAHRKHASTYGVPSIVANRGMGLLIEKELKFLDPMLNQAQRPFLALLGGSKVSDKIKTIDALMVRVQGIAIGGAMAHAFWAATGVAIPEGAKQPKSEDIEAAKHILQTAKKRDLEFVLPTDTHLGFDIGPKTIERFKKFLSPAKTIFWNGPLGWFEKPEYATGTFQIAEFISNLHSVKVVGGGDTVSAVKQSGFARGFDHLSTGGGAVLEFIENDSLPGIEILKTYRQAKSPTLQFKEQLKVGPNAGGPTRAGANPPDGESSE